MGKWLSAIIPVAFKPDGIEFVVLAALLLLRAPQRIILFAILSVGLGIAMVLSGCAALSPQGAIAPAGTAVYDLACGADGSSTLRITSARELTDAKIHLGPNCTLDASASATSGLAQGLAAQAQATQALTDLLRSVVPIAAKAAGVP